MTCTATTNTTNPEHIATAPVTTRSADAQGDPCMHTKPSVDRAAEIHLHGNLLENIDGTAGPVPFVLELRLAHVDAVHRHLTQVPSRLTLEVLADGSFARDGGECQIIAARFQYVDDTRIALDAAVISDVDPGSTMACEMQPLLMLEIQHLARLISMSAHGVTHVEFVQDVEGGSLRQIESAPSMSH